jgi:D-inositol-3-phosphate glycosyltransferase
MRIAMLSYHTCPLATLGGKDTGGMNVYVRELTRHLGQLGVHVDVFTRSQDEHVPHVLHDLGYGNRVVHVPAGPEKPLPKPELAAHIPQFVQGIRSFAREKGLQYDLIHSHYWMSGLAGVELQAEWNVPLIHMFHTLVLMKNRVARSPDEVEGDYRLKGELAVLRRAQGIIAATQAEQAQLQFTPTGARSPSSRRGWIPAASIPSRRTRRAWRSACPRTSACCSLLGGLSR